MEIFLFLALYSEIKGSEEARYMASIILADTHKKELNNQPYSLLKGRLGVSWGIQYLANKNILEVDDETMKFRSIGMQDRTLYLLYITLRKCLYQCFIPSYTFFYRLIRQAYILF